VKTNVLFCQMKSLIPRLCGAIVLLSIFSAILVAQPNRDCRVNPPYVQRKGFEPQSAAFSTADRYTMGLVLTELNPKAGQKAKTYQHPSWQNAGWLGPMVITEKGEVWVAPVPRINTLKNKPKEQNRLWRVSPLTEEMSMAIDLPIPATATNNQNPFGLIGLGYDCDLQVLYASSVAGSSMEQARGSIFAIRCRDKKIISTLDSLDAFGLGVGSISGSKRLYYGSARSGDIFSVALDADGGIIGKSKLELTLEDLGPRGDDRARKIRFSPDGTLTITGVEFYFNLTAPTEKQETIYQFKFNALQQKWVLSGIQ
jgi:hypothetical protein